jgi:Mannosyl-glycoprotein endo-beta-N-acetylglucosaminidase
VLSGGSNSEQSIPYSWRRKFQPDLDRSSCGRENNIDPILPAAISAHESGGWKSRIARQKNNWLGLMTRSGAKSFGTPEESIFCAADLLNRKPFKGRDSLSQIAPIYCTKNPGHWKAPFFIMRSSHSYEHRRGRTNQKKCLLLAYAMQNGIEPSLQQFLFDCESFYIEDD